MGIDNEWPPLKKWIMGIIAILLVSVIAFFTNYIVSIFKAGVDSSKNIKIPTIVNNSEVVKNLDRNYNRLRDDFNNLQIEHNKLQSIYEELRAKYIFRSGTIPITHRGDETVNFSSPFKDAPIVMISDVGSDDNNGEVFATMPERPNRKSFKVRLVKPNGGFAIGAINWVAIGKPTNETN